MARSQDERSLGELFAELSRETGVLVRKEVELATTEMTAKARTAAALLVLRRADDLRLAARPAQVPCRREASTPTPSIAGTGPASGRSLVPPVAAAIAAIGNFGRRSA